MTRCDNNTCDKCTCGRRHVRSAVDSFILAANSNFPPVKKPKRVVRRNPRAAAVSLEKRFKETMKLLS